MIITSLNLNAYGKFENKRLNLKKGLNIIYGENGSGKTTVSTALKMFLYRNFRGELKYKKKYIPLGEKQGFFDVCFENDSGEAYESLITVGATAAKTVYKTIKKSNGSEILLGDSEIGEYFLNTAEDMYDSVCYLRDPNDFSRISANGATVNEELSGTVSEERSGVDLANAIDELSKEIILLTRKTATGKIFPLKNELAELNRAIAEIDDISEESELLKKRISGLKNDLKSAEQRYIFLCEEEKKNEVYEEYKKYIKYSTGIKKSDELKKMIESVNPVKCEMTKEEFNFLKDNEQKLKEEASVPKQNKLFIPLALIGIILSLLSIVSFYMLIGAVAAFAAAAVIYFKNKQTAAETEKDNEIKKSIRKKISDICIKYNIENSDDYIEKNKKYSEELLKRESLQRELESVLSIVSEEHVKEFIEEPPVPSMELNCVKNEKNKCTAEITELKSNIAALTEKKKSLFNNLPEYEELIRRRGEVTDLINEREYELRVAQTALEVMEITKDTYKESYLPILVKKTEEILKNLSENEVDKFILSGDFRPQLREKNSPFVKESEYLSSGINDSVYFALRLAVYDLAFSGREKPPLILDDSFMRMDDKRAENWISYLRKKDDCQIIYLTAGKRIFNLGVEKDTVLGL